MSVSQVCQTFHAECAVHAHCETGLMCMSGLMLAESVTTSAGVRKSIVLFFAVSTKIDNGCHNHAQAALDSSDAPSPPSATHAAFLSA